MTAALFPTITPAHWREMFARHRASGRDHGNNVLAQIRAGVAHSAAQRLTQGSSAAERLTHNQEATGSTPVPASTLTVAGSLAGEEGASDRRSQGEVRPRAAGGGENFPYIHGY